MVRPLVILLCSVAFVGGAQDLRFSAAKKLTSNINSSCEEIFPLLSPDQNVLYFVRASCAENTGGRFAGSDIWLSRYNAATREWSRPTNTEGVVNDKTNNALVGISSDGAVTYQLNTSSSKDTPGIYFSKRLHNSWTKPQLIPLPNLHTEEFLGLFVSADFSVILVSLRNSEGVGQEDLYVSLKGASGEWSSPRSLGSVINTEGFEISPFLTADKKRLYFTSSGHWGMGDGDIFYSDRLDDSWENWSTPVSLGSEINSTKFDAYFSIYDSIAYFSSNRDGQLSDLYVTRIEREVDSTQLRIERLVAEARVLLSDLGDDTSDSLATDLRSIFIAFENDSFQMTREATAKLNSVVARIKNRESNTVTLVAYPNGAELKEDDLSYRRLKAISNYLREVPLQNLKLEIELKRRGDDEVGRIGLVEVKYEH